MSDKSNFVKQAKSEMPDFIKKAIDNLLKKLNSKIELPRNQSGNVIEGRLLKVVQSREAVYDAVCELMDIINIDKNIDTKYKSRIIEGMKTTWHELTTLIVRTEPFDEENIEFQDFIEESDGLEYISRDSISDDHFSSISKSIVIASKLCDKIIGRIATLEDPDYVNKEKLNSNQIESIVELYAD